MPHEGLAVVEAPGAEHVERGEQIAVSGPEEQPAVVVG
jgi:hypothetical protein